MKGAVVKACGRWEPEKWNPTRCRHCFQPKERHDESNSSASSSSTYSAHPSSSASSASSSTSSKVFSTATKFGAVKSSSKSSFVPANVSSTPQSSFKTPTPAPNTTSSSKFSKPSFLSSKTSKSSFVPGSQAQTSADSSSPLSAPAPWSVKLKSTGLIHRDSPSSSSSSSSNNTYAAMYNTPASASTTVMTPLERKPSVTQSAKSNFARPTGNTVVRQPAPIPVSKTSTLSRSVSNPQDERSVLQARREREEAEQRQREQELQRQKQLAITSETGYFVMMLYDYEVDGQHLRSGDVLGLVNWDDPNWWFVTRNTTGLRAYVPSEYVATTDPPSTSQPTSQAPSLPPKPSLGAGGGVGGGGVSPRGGPSPRGPGGAVKLSTPAVRKAMANFDFDGMNKGEISMKSGDIVVVLDSQDPNWWFVRHNQTHQSGFVPSNYLVLADSAHEEPQRPSTRVSVQPNQIPPQGTPHKVQAYALYDFVAQQEGELSCKFSELFNILDRSEAEWWFVERKQNGETGWLPSSYLSIVDQDTIDAYYEKKKSVQLTPGGGGYQHPGATPIVHATSTSGQQQQHQGNQQTPEGSNCIIS